MTQSSVARAFSLPSENSDFNRKSTPRTVDGVARYRSKRGEAIARRLSIAAHACGSPVALGMADMMRECSAPSNLWTASDLHNPDGEAFDGVGTLAACGSRLCPSCSADLRRRSRRRARMALADFTLRSGELFRFVTLTMPTVPDASLIDTLRVIQRAWSLLRKRKFWMTCVRGGIKGVEFTVTAIGYHAHLHLLVASKWIEHARLRSEWTECLRAAWSEQALDIVFNTPSGEAIVDVRLIRAKHRGSSRVAVSVENALQEVSKYVTKSESWDAVPDAHLVEIAEVKRWQRLFEVFGEMRARVGAEAEAEPERATASVHTPDVSDGAQLRIPFPEQPRKRRNARAPTLRTLMVTLERPAWLKILAARFSERREHRRTSLTQLYPYARFRSLSGDAFVGTALRSTLAA
jgi:hypothetical protein